MLKKWVLCVACVLLAAGTAFADDTYYIGSFEKAAGRKNFAIRPMFSVDFHYNLITDRMNGIKTLPDNFASAGDFAKVRQEFPQYLAGNYACLSDQQSITGKFSNLKRPWRYDSVADVGTYQLSGVDYKGTDNSCLMTSDSTDIRLETNEERNSFRTDNMISAIREVTDTIDNLKADGLYDVNTATKTYSFYLKGKIYIAVTKITAVPTATDSNLPTVKKVFVIIKKQQIYKIAAAFDGSDAVELVAVIDPSLIPVRSGACCNGIPFGEPGTYLMLRNENHANVTYVLLGLDNDVGVTRKYEYTYKKP